jgi:hypothetical protein
MTKTTATVGVADHGGWAVLLTVVPEGVVVDRRRVTLVDDGLPPLPHHHEAQMLPCEAGVALVNRVRASAQQRARAALEDLAAEVPIPIRGIALRKCPELPPTIAERIANYRAQNVADWVMYREAIAEAARARGWSVSWYDAKLVFDEAAKALGRKTINDLLLHVGKSLGPPWRKDHKVAMAAALAVAKGRSPSAGARRSSPSRARHS